MVYVILILFILYCGVYYYFPQLRKVSITFIVVSLTLVMGLRGHQVGIDTSHYQDLFNIISHESFYVLFKDFFYEALEPGWVLLNKLVSTLGGDYYVFQFFVSMVICCIFVYVLRMESKNAYISIIVFLPIIYLISFNIQRQILACAILFLCWHLMIKSRYYFSLIFFLIACSIHVTSILFLYVVCLYCLRESKFFSPFFIISILVLFSSYLVFIDLLGVFFTKYHNYYNNMREVQSVGFVKILWIMELIFSVYIFVRKNIFTVKDRCIAALSVLCICSYFIGLKFNYFERVGLMFSPFILLMFPILGNSFCKSLRLIYNTSIIVFFILWFYLSMKSPQYEYSSWL